MRRVSEVQLGLKSLVPYQDLQTDQAIILAYEILTDPKNRAKHILRATASVILSLLYDQAPLKSLNDSSVNLMDEYLHKATRAAQPGNNLVEIFPVLEYIPAYFSKWKRESTADFRKFSSMLEEKYMGVKERMLSGEQRSSFCATLLENGPEKHGLSDLESVWAAATIYGAAYETTARTLSWFLFLMIHFPDVQKKAQDEIEAVVGRSRMPSFSDMNHLPYVRALTKEILRWRPPAPMGVPHASTEHDYYEGQLIPKGSICISSIWSINRDPEIYGADAEEFRPERHLNPDGTLKDEKGDGHFTFGFGRRECVGRHFANKALLIEISMLLWAIRIEAPAGVEIPHVSEDIGEGVISRPPDFDCVIEPRFEGVGVALKQARDMIFQTADDNGRE
ncbi:cytochrome P450 [Dendrothele bispora CBS 962.96]|uniref:Cytochrome P450 n=1 Tax=Dendrothele bispora (strain CBS 962.96) TaxID=1314807 RepID=A0A4S8L4D1_DENBC|nr:cytochrome P450 [Dendrothele bispora CBS 962.96]